jgi:hypothetical protein
LIDQRMRRIAGGATVVLALAGCAVPVPSPSPSPSATVAPSPAPSPTLAATIPITVSFKGRVNCNIGFDFYCSPWLSVLEPGTNVDDAWRPSVTDPLWQTRGDGMQAVDGKHWKLLRGSPATAPGRKLLVVSLVGQSDIQSYNPDGTVATELMGRCAREVDVAANAERVDIVVTFKPDPATGRATCKIKS